MPESVLGFPLRKAPNSSVGVTSSMLWRNDTQKLCKSGGNQFLPRPVVRQAVLPHVQDRPAGTHQAARVPEIRLSYSLPAGTAQQTRRKQILSDLAFRSDFGHTKGRPLCIKMSVPSVELRGFEPLTFSLRTRRATNCAIAPKYSQKPKRVTGKFANYEAVGLRSRKITRLCSRQAGRFITI